MKSRATIFFALYLAATIYLTLFPWNFQSFPKAPGLFWEPIVGRRDILDATLNTLLFLPLGASGFLAFGRRWWSALTAVAVCAAVSWTIESTQLWTPTRFGNLTDFTTNSVGAFLGCALAWWIDYSHGWPSLLRHRHFTRWNLTLEQALFGSLWVLWQAFPFVPAIALLRLSQFVTPAPWSWPDFAQVLVGAAVVATALEGSPWIWIAFAVMPAQAFLMQRQFSYAALLGAAAGIGVAKLAPWRTAMRWLLPLWMSYEEFRPFRLAPVMHPLLWLPFDSWYESSSSLRYYAVVFGKLFLYTATVWSLRRNLRGERPKPWLWAVGIPALILAAGEWSQQYLDGRTPESTDVVLLAAGAVLLGLCSESLPKAGPAHPAS